MTSSALLREPLRRARRITHTPRASFSPRLASEAIFRTSRTPSIQEFQKTVLAYWKKNGRHGLAWRRTKDPYRILVSEVMLQQTQVVRVKGKYQEFLKAFPNVRVLAKAPLAEVLRTWSGLGYNRRAKFLHDAAKVIVKEHGGHVPRDVAALRALPGVGDYTAKAVRVFAFNKSEVLIETNIRTVFLHYFHIWKRRKVSDKELLPYMGARAKNQDPRTWHWALMDYGAQLKSSGVRVNARSKHYTKQSKFEGSLRQVRGAILKALARNGSVEDVRDRYADRFEQAFESLTKDGFIPIKGDSIVV